MNRINASQLDLGSSSLGSTDPGHLDLILHSKVFSIKDGVFYQKCSTKVSGNNVCSYLSILFILLKRVGLHYGSIRKMKKTKSIVVSKK